MYSEPCHLAYSIYTVHIIVVIVYRFHVDLFVTLVLFAVITALTDPMRR